MPTLRMEPFKNIAESGEKSSYTPANNFFFLGGGGGVYWDQPVGWAVGQSGLSAKSCPDNPSYSFSPIRLILRRSVH